MQTGAFSENWTRASSFSRLTPSCDFLDCFRVTWLCAVARGREACVPVCSTRGNASSPPWPGAVTVHLTQASFGVGASHGFFLTVGWWCFDILMICHEHLKAQGKPVTLSKPVPQKNFLRNCRPSGAVGHGVLSQLPAAGGFHSSSVRTDYSQTALAVTLHQAMGVGWLVLGDNIYSSHACLRSGRFSTC